MSLNFLYVVILCALLMCFCINKKSFLIFFLAIPIVFYIFCIVAPITYLQQLPFLNVSYTTDVEVDKAGSFYIESSIGGLLSDGYVIDSETTIDDINKYLKDKTKAIFIYIKDGDEFLYNRELGNPNENSAQEILTIYKKWRETGKLEKEKRKLQFKIFYIET